ncbi:zonadhesin-like [Branchiostoma floridae x Branchiostoma belcheri]
MVYIYLSTVKLKSGQRAVMNQLRFTNNTEPVLYADTMAGPCTSGFWSWLVLVLMATTATVSGQECPIAGYVRFNGVCYKDFPELKTYDSARQTCAADGGLLAMPKNSAINTFIHNLTEAGLRWIGLTDTEGQWVFADGQTLESTGYTNWYPDEPNNVNGGEHCAVTNFRSTDEWNDEQCRFPMGFICQLVCIEDKATCTAWGDPHFKTFDGRKYTFQGPCRYTFAEQCGNSSSDFTVEVQQVPTTQNPSVSIVREVYVMAYGYEITIGQRKVVTVKRIATFSSNTVTGPSTNNTIPATPPFSQAMGNIQVTLSGINVRVELIEFCVVILYNGVNRIEVTIPANYRNMMCGLCGNYNTMGTDDLVMPNGNIASNVNEFGNSWETDNNTCHARRRKRQTSTQEPCDPIYSDPCNVHKDPNGPFAVCHDVVDPQIHFETCVFDECATQGQGVFLCANLEAYYHSCIGAGVPPFTWRTSELCPLDCPANSTYSSCATACPATCVNPSAPDSCNLPCVEDCECDPGYVQSGLDCVPQTDCGCSSNSGYYHKLGAVWENNGEECECHAGNTVVCEAGVPLGTAVGAAVGVAGIMVLLIVVFVLAKIRAGLASGKKKRDADAVGLDNYAYQSLGKMSKTGIADTKA